jgi:hypothetical protein
MLETARGARCWVMNERDVMNEWKDSEWFNRWLELAQGNRN